MGSNENPVVKRVMMEASRLDLRLLRNNRGLFWTLDKSRKTRAGLEAKGASDLIGITTITIRPEDVGRRIGVFTAVEVKEPEWKKPSGETEEDQQNFINQVKLRGGIGFFINNHEKLKESIDSQIASV